MTPESPPLSVWLYTFILLALVGGGLIAAQALGVDIRALLL